MHRTLPSLLLTLALCWAGLAGTGAPAGAAGIGELADSYQGLAYSSLDAENEEISLVLNVAKRTGSRFTGELVVDTDEGPFTLPATGTVSRSGKLSARALILGSGLRGQILLTAQLSATGRSVVGTFKLFVRDRGGSTSDAGTVVFLRQSS